MTATRPIPAAPPTDDPVDPDRPADRRQRGRRRRRGDGGGNGGGDGFEQVPGQAGQGNGGGGKGGGKADDPKPKDEGKDPDEPIEPPEDRNADGSPTNTNPTVTIADYGAAPMGVPNFVIDQFTIPPFLLPIYQACGTQYGMPWEVLASINRIETAFGTNLNVSSAGALGWMQFIPSSWEAYGVDANNDGRKDPYNPVDAICAAANYLDAAGAQEDLSSRDIRLQPRRLVRRRGPPLRAPVRQDPRRPRRLAHRPHRGRPLPGRREVPLRGRHLRARGARARDAEEGQSGNAADVISSSPTERGINIYSREGAPVVAVNDGVIKRIGKSDRLGRYIVLEDAYGNRFTYAELGEVAKAYPVPKRRKNPMRDLFVESEEKPDEPASAGKQPERRRRGVEAEDRGRGRRARQHGGLTRTPLRLPRARRERGAAQASPASSTTC